MLASLCIMITPPMLEAARLSTPDMLSCVFLVITFRLMQKTGKSFAIFILLTLSILVRIDNLIFAIVMIIIYFLFEKKESGFNRPLGSSLLMIFCWVSISAILMALSNYQNGFNIFYGGILQRLNPANLIFPLITGLNTLQTSQVVLVVALAGVSMFYKRELSIATLSRDQGLYLGIVFYVVIKFIFFPDLTTRLFLPVYVIGIVLVFNEISRFRNQHLTSKP
jgi:hypothetical protein